MAETDGFELPGDETEYLILEQAGPPGPRLYHHVTFADDNGDITKPETLQAFADNLPRQGGMSRPRVVKKTTTYELWEDGEPPEDDRFCPECGAELDEGCVSFSPAVMAAFGAKLAREVDESFKLFMDDAEI